MIYPQTVETLDFDKLLLWANIFSVPHYEAEWMDDEWPDREDDLRADVVDAIDKFNRTFGRNCNE